MSDNNGHNTSHIAVIGMSGRFPGADSVDTFWRNLRDGVESITFYTDEDLAAAGVPEHARERPGYIKARPVLDGIEMFDAAFFGYGPKEAAMTAPHHRMFLESAWEALESAGYDTERYTGRTGVFAGSGMNSYLLNNLYPHAGIRESPDILSIIIGNDKDFLPTRVSYKLNLKGPSLAVQTACSTSLVAVHLACQSLLVHESDLALAGGVSINVPQQSGYHYQEGGILSPDGHCRPFDAQAAGTIFGSGLGIVVLKRLADALEDGDTILAVIKGSAINNDGGVKVGYTAPSVSGQAEVIAEAMAMAGVEPETISYVEAHGTGTALGDPIEIEALTQVFRKSTALQSFCAIGSAKGNVGHLDAAAGVTGLIKAILALNHKQLPPSLHYTSPNPRIDFANSPFLVNNVLREWPEGATPRRAGVSAFGIGGTNAHVVLEEAPGAEPSDAGRPTQLLLLSARTHTALDTATGNLAAFLAANTGVNLADAAYTLQIGRRAFPYRRAIACVDVADAVRAIGSNDPRRVFTGGGPGDARAVAFCFPGQGSQYVSMGRDLYAAEAVFRHHIDRCSEILMDHLGFDIRPILYPDDGQADEAADKLTRTGLAQPALFTIEYALAQLWMSWGVMPAAMIGHSIGEYAAACLADVFTLEEALFLVSARGRMIEALPGGAMLAVPLAEAELLPLLGAHGLSLASVSGPSECVASGAAERIEALRTQLTGHGLNCRPLHTSHAFHSDVVDAIIEPFSALFGTLTPRSPRIPYISNVTGTWITDAEAVSAAYWAAHLRRTVRFSGGVQELLRNPDLILLEIGPGTTLTSLALRQPGTEQGTRVFASMRHPRDAQSDTSALMSALGKVWIGNARVDWPAFSAGERRRRIPLPAYPFERQLCWIDPPARAFATEPGGPAGLHLASPSQSGVESASVPLPAMTATEARLSGIWTEVLGIAHPGIHDNFFDAGGNSLLATQLIGRIRTEFATDLPLKDCFAAPTIAGLAELIELRLLNDSGAESIDDLLDMLEAMDDSEARALLALEDDTPPVGLDEIAR